MHERIWVRGGFLHLAMRKRFVDDSVRAALKAGATQLVVLGGGLDTLALRVAEDEPSCHVFELDHPDSQFAKRRGLDAFATRPSNLSLEAVDLGRVRLRDALARIADFDAHAPTVFVAEGLFMYLDPTAVERLLDDVAAHGVSGSRLVFTFLEADALGRPIVGHAAARTRLLLKVYGEPLRSGFELDGLRAYLGARGLHLFEQWDERRLLQRYLPDQDAAVTPMLDWEYAAIAGLP